MNDRQVGPARAVLLACVAVALGGCAGPAKAAQTNEAEAAMFAKNNEYEHFMGRWSRLLSPMHLQFAGVRDGARVLDVGAGTGALASLVAERFPKSEVVGIDPSPTFVEYAQRKAGSNRVRFEVGDAQALALRRRFVRRGARAVGDELHPRPPEGGAARCAG